MKYIGLDAHSRNCFFVILSKSGKLLEKVRIVTAEMELLNYVRSIKGRKKLILEESSISQWIYILLKDEVDELIICQPVASSGPKTDWIDATELADSLRINKFKEVFHSDTALMELRSLVSGYQDLQQEIVRTKNRYSALFRQCAISIKKSKMYHFDEAIPCLSTENMRYVAASLGERLILLQKQKAGFVELFERNVLHYKEIRLLTTIPGIAATRANQIAAIVVTPYRFSSKYKFYAYSMLVKHNRISDGKSYGKRSPHGQSTLKKIFKASAHSALMGQSSFRRHYEMLKAQGKDEKASRNSVSRLIAATTLGIWKSGKKYDDKYMEVIRRRNKIGKVKTENI